MPRCYQLTPKNSSQPAKLADVDDMIRAHFNVPPDPKRYYLDWHNIIGLSLALGHVGDLHDEKFRQHIADVMEFSRDREAMIAIVDYLREHFTSAAFYDTRR